MILDLVNVSQEEIIASIDRSVSYDNKIKVMYLQNNGDEKHYWKTDDFSAWASEDMDN